LEFCLHPNVNFLICTGVPKTVRKNEGKGMYAGILIDLGSSVVYKIFFFKLLDLGITHSSHFKKWVDNDSVLGEHPITSPTDSGDSKSIAQEDDPSAFKVNKYLEKPRINKLY
jgi:hypothetical protein